MDNGLTKRRGRPPNNNKDDSAPDYTPAKDFQPKLVDSEGFRLTEDDSGSGADDKGGGEKAEVQGLPTVWEDPIEKFDLKVGKRHMLFHFEGDQSIIVKLRELIFKTVSDEKDLMTKGGTVRTDYRKLTRQKIRPFHGISKKQFKILLMENGWDLKAIADKFEANYSSAYRAMKKLGISLKDKHDYRKPGRPPSKSDTSKKTS